MPPTRLHYRIAIVGSGPAGWTAALYSARADLEPIVIQGQEPGGQLMTTTEVENYPGFEKGINGPEMMEVFRKQAERFGTEVLHDIVTDIDFEARPFRLTLDSGGNLTADPQHGRRDVSDGRPRAPRVRGNHDHARKQQAVLLFGQKFSQ